MSRPTPRKLTVLRTANISKNMKRITFGGSELASFPEDQDSAYIKLLFAKPQVATDTKPTTRTYTIRRFDSVAQELDVDCVIHGDNGPASKWAINAVAGDQMHIAGPGAKKLVDFNADWFFLVGDMTALPAISVNLENLPRDAKGYLVMEIIDEADKQEDIDIPEGIEVHWVVNPHPDQQNSLLVDRVKTLDFPAGTASIWVACEFSSMRALRAYFKKDKQVDRKHIYISSYWKMGLSEEGHKTVKQKDSQDQS